MLIKLATSLISTWGNTNIYYFSYYREQGYTFTTSSNSTIVLIIIIPMIICMLISPYLCNRYGYEFVTRCCAFTYLIIPQFVNINFNFYLFIIVCLLIPTCCFAISTVPVLNCVWTQF